MKPVKIITLKKPISYLRYINGKIGVIDKQNTFRMFDINDFSLVGGFKIKLPENNPLENTVAISPYGNYVAVAVKNKHSATIWDVNTKKLLHILKWHKGEILSLSFDYDENYLLTGGMDGRAYIWSVETGNMVISLPPHPDYVLSCDFSKNSLWSATGSYDKLITITNLSSLNINYRKKSHRGAVTQVKFFKDKMISGDKTGEIIIWNYTKGQVLNRFHNVADMVVDMDSDEKEEYLFVITKTYYVYLYDLNTYELISDKFIKLSELPSSIVYVPEKNYLWVGTLGGGIYIFDLYLDEEKLNKLVEDKKFDEAYSLVKENPFLKRTQAYKKMEKIWDTTLAKAYKLMELSHYDEARGIFRPFLNVPEKRNVIQSILKDFGEFEKFKQAVIKRKYPLAYSLAEMYPSFRETAYYKKMENEWKKTFAKARELIKFRGRDDEIRKLLLPFRGVSSKTPLIQSLFNDKQLYDLIRNFLLSKKFDKFFELIQIYPFLYDTPEYEKAMEFAKKVDNLIKQKLAEGNYKDVLNYADILENFPKYKDKAKEYKDKAQTLIRFLNALANNKYDTVEKLVKDYGFLSDTVDYENYKNKITKIFKKAELFASKGNIKEIKKALEPLKDSETFSLKIKGIFKSAYLNQLLDVLTKGDKEKLQKGIQNYILYFGMDNEIEDIMDMAKKLQLNIKISNFDKERKFRFDKMPDFVWEDV